MSFKDGQSFFCCCVPLEEQIKDFWQGDPTFGTLLKQITFSILEI